MPDESKQNRPDPRGREGGSPLDPGRQRWTTIFWILAAIAVFTFLQFDTTSVEEISYSRFRDLVEEDRVTEVSVTANAVEGEIDRGAGTQRFTATLPPNFDTAELVTELDEAGVDVSG